MILIFQKTPHTHDGNFLHKLHVQDGDMFVKTSNTQDENFPSLHHGRMYTAQPASQKPHPLPLHYTEQLISGGARLNHKH